MTAHPGNRNHNLVDKTETSPPKTRGFYIALSFRILAVVAALCFGFAYKIYLDGGGNITWMLAALAAYSIMSAYSTIFTPSGYERTLFLILETLGLFAFFWSLPLKLLAIAIVAVFLILFWGVRLTLRELETGIKIRFFRVLRPQFAKTVTALTLFVVLVYAPRINTQSEFVSKSGVESFIGSMSDILKRVYPEINFSPAASVKSTVRSIISYKYGANKLITGLAPENQEKLLDEAANQFVSALSKNLEMDINDDETLSQVSHSAVSARLKNWQEHFGIGFTLAWALLMFVLIRSIGALASWVSRIFGFVLYQTLLVSGIVHIAGETRTKEVLEL